MCPGEAGGQGASSAFKSGTKRLFSPGGKIADHEIYPGKRTEDVPGVGSYTPEDPSLNGLFGRVARINVAADSSVTLRLNLAPSCTPLETNCAACEHADMSASEQSACYAQGCSCYMQPCFSATCCDEAQQLAAALEVAAKAGDAPECARLLPNVLSACERAAAAAAATGTSAAEWKSRPAPTPQQPDA